MNFLGTEPQPLLETTLPVSGETTGIFPQQPSHSFGETEETNIEESREHETIEKTLIESSFDSFAVIEEEEEEVLDEEIQLSDEEEDMNGSVVVLFEHFI